MMSTLSERVLLWPAGAPGAMGQEPEDCPAVQPYLLPADAPSACVVICPGGGYGRRAPHEGEPVARWLNSIGIAAVVLHYRVAPYRHPYPLMDAQRALRLVRQNASLWRIDPRRVGILGFSAGGHLAVTLATHFDSGDAAAADPVEKQTCRPDLAVLCYPVISFLRYQHTGSMTNLLGAAPSEQARQELSNELHVTAETPPTFLWHTASDTGVPVENSIIFASALSACKVPFELHVYPQGRHGLGLAAEDPHVGTWTGLCARFFNRCGFGED